MKFTNYYFLAIVATCFGGVHCQAGAKPSGTENYSNNNVVKECVNKPIAITYQLYTPPVSKNDIIKVCTNKPTVTTYKLYTPTISKNEVIKGCTNKPTVTTYRLYTLLSNLCYCWYVQKLQIDVSLANVLYLILCKSTTDYNRK
ncbi:hypothetical protein DSO57_1015855 [Entomophthora muscae]|uniref:Uncharacterized protein n=1 Tax=Entomophthora muscae TaxID=34485 RepID=A0ACC2UPU0_9FUNG|nr:hypothetical protein DSO57_1015855 [Entomophthora muscae]